MIVILQGPTWFDALRILGFKEAIVRQKREAIVFQYTSSYNIAGVDDSKYLRSVILSEMNSLQIKSHIEKLGIIPTAIWTSSEELTLVAAELGAFHKLNGPSLETAILGLDKYKLKEWLKEKKLPFLDGVKLSPSEWERGKKDFGDKQGVIIKPQSGRGAIASQPWHYQIFKSIEEFERQPYFKEALETNDSVIESFTGFGTESDFYDVHVWFGSNIATTKIFLVGQWISASDGRILQSFGQVNLKMRHQLEIMKVVENLASDGYRNHLANLQFAVQEDIPCLIDFNTRSAGVWALLQNKMAPDFYDTILLKNSLKIETFVQDCTHYEKGPFPLVPTKALLKIEIPKCPTWIKLAYTEKLIEGYQVPAILNSLQPNPQIIAFGSSTEECKKRFVEFTSSIRVHYKDEPA